MPARARPMLACLFLPLLAGCVVGPDYQRPASAAPAAQAVATPDGWWAGFGDPELVRVVVHAQAGNLDIAQAEARVRESRALARAAGAALAPMMVAGQSQGRPGPARNDAGDGQCVSGAALEVTRTQGAEIRVDPISPCMYSGTECADKR